MLQSTQKQFIYFGTTCMQMPCGVQQKARQKADPTQAGVACHVHCHTVACLGCLQPNNPQDIRMDTSALHHKGVRYKWYSCT
jgi:hypothetical protein